jgi:pyruvate-formate lyase-activating enzyme
MDEGHVFRYRLGDTGRKPVHSDRLAEMVRQQLCNILDIAQLLQGDSEAAADTFRFLGPERRTYELYNGNGSTSAEPGSHAKGPGGHAPLSGAATAFGREAAGSGDAGGLAPSETSETSLPAGGNAGQEEARYGKLANAALYEPRIEFIARQLASLLSMVELESGGEPVRIDGFRLRDLGDWIGPHAANPADIFNHAATRCQYDCIFCYNRGSVESLEQPPHSPGREWKELETRVRHYNPRAGRGLFPTFGSPHETLAHPHILTLLRALREKTGEPFRLCSNGGVLDKDFVAALAELAPVYLDLSLNSSSPQRRSMLMADRHPEKAIGAPALLADAGIPFAVTIVAWPYPDLEEMLRDLEGTARYADAEQARLVQVNLPGYSRFFSAQELFDTGEVWGETVRLVQRLREELACPIVVSPSLYEENLTRPRKNQPEVIGVVRNSPAACWGLTAGDMMTAVNGIPVKSRPQARDLLALLQESGTDRAAMTVLREGRSVELAGDTGDWSYPFDPITGTHLGTVFMGAGLRTSYLERLEALVRESGAREALFLTSTLVRPTLEQLLRERPLSLPEGTRLRLGVPENRFFGGNIMLGDLLVVQDFIDFVNEQPGGTEARPDLVVIPSSPFHLSGWGRDLTGRTYLDIARETGVAVRLLECHPIWE